MFVSLSFEKTESSDVSIVVDAFRASTTITMGFNNFKRVIPAFSPDHARLLAKKYDGILVGERLGQKLEGFDLGNSPEKVANYKTDKDVMVITTTNGTRIMEDMDSKVLIGGFVNAKAVACKALELADDCVDLVMAGREGNFALEDYIACGEILYWIDKFGDDLVLSEYAQSSILASRDVGKCDVLLKKTKSAKILEGLGYSRDVNFSLKRNISDNVAVYSEGEFNLI